MTSSEANAQPRLGRLRTFRSLRHRDFRLYFFGQVVSFIGSWMQSTAMMWLVYDLTNDSLWPALMLVAAVGPTLFLGPFSGSLADRVPKRSLVMTTQSLFLIHALVLTTLVGQNRISPVGLLLMQFVNGFIQAIDLPARLSFVPDLIPREDLINAVSLNAMAFNAARFIGPSLTAPIYLIVGSTANVARNGAMLCFAINTLSFAAVLIALLRVRAGRSSSTDRKSQSVWSGLHFLIQERALGLLVVLTGLLCVFTWPVLTLLPAFTRTVVGLEEKAFSMFVSSLGSGALVAACMTATFGSVRRRRTFLAVGAVLASLGVLGLSQSVRIGTVVLASGLTGFGLITYLSTGQSTMQMRSPDAIRGRVMAFWAMTLSASAPVGHLLAGWAAQVWPVPRVLFVMGCGATVTSVAIAVLCRRRGLKG